MLQDNINKLISLYEEQKYRSVRLAAELEARENEVARLQTQIADLKRQVGNLQLGEALSSGAMRPSDAREKIDAIVAEIDRCISYIEG